MNIRNVIMAAVAMAVVLGNAAESKAGFLYVNIGGAFQTGTGITLNNDAIQLKFTDTGTNEVSLEILANVKDAATSTFIVAAKDFDVYFNTNLWSLTDSVSYNVPISMDWVAGVKGKNNSLTGSYDSNAFDYSSTLGKFDAKISFGGSSGQLLNGQTSTWKLKGTGTTSIDVNTFNNRASSGATNTLAAAHIGGLPVDANGAASGKYGSTYGGSDPPPQSADPVPEPASMALWLTVAVGGAFVARRKSKKTVC